MEGITDILKRANSPGRIKIDKKVSTFYKKSLRSSMVAKQNGVLTSKIRHCDTASTSFFFLSIIICLRHEYVTLIVGTIGILHEASTDTERADIKTEIWSLKRPAIENTTLEKNMIWPGWKAEKGRTTDVNFASLPLRALLTLPFLVAISIALCE